MNSSNQYQDLEFCFELQSNTHEPSINTPPTKDKKTRLKNKIEQIKCKSPQSELTKHEIRKIKNRQSAQQSREKRLNMVTHLQQENQDLRNQLKDRDVEIKDLRYENNSLKKRLGLNYDSLSTEFESAYQLPVSPLDSPDQNFISEDFGWNSPTYPRKSSAQLGLLGFFTVLCLISLFSGFSGNYSSFVEIKAIQEPQQPIQEFNVTQLQAPIPLQDKLDDQIKQIPTSKIVVKNEDSNDNKDSKAIQLSYQGFQNPNIAMKISIEFLSVWPGERVFFLNCKVNESEICYQMLQFLISKQLSYLNNVIMVKNNPLVQEKAHPDNKLMIYNVTEDTNQVLLQTTSCMVVDSCTERFTKDQLTTFMN